MSAILFGSISTIADTSELQREAFNQAFEAHGLPWRWDNDDYVTMLSSNGGRQRIADYAASVGQRVDADAVHASKSAFFQKNLASSPIVPRPGVIDTIAQAKRNGVKVALVTTTSSDNVTALIDALHPDVLSTAFDVIVDSSCVDRSKPEPDAYLHALETLDETASDCVAIEDNVGGAQSAVAAGVICVAFPNENTAQQDFDVARHCVDRLDFAELHKLIAE